MDIKKFIGAKAKNKETGEVFEILMFHFRTGEIWVDKKGFQNWWEDINKYDLIF